MKNCFTNSLVNLCLISGIGLSNMVYADAAKIICPDDGKVCREEGTMLPLRLLPKPFSNIYKDPREIDANVVYDNIKAFVPIYAYKMKDIDTSDPTAVKGWYKVGRTISKSDGWIKASDVMEWRQPLVVAYTHPGSGDDRRKSVLMFDQLDPLKAFVAAADSDPNTAEQVYKSIANKKMVEHIVTKEPEAFIDITKIPYIYPVVNYEEVNVQGEDARFLQVAVQLPGQRSDGTNTTTLENKEFQDQALKESALEQGENLKVDVVFVMDITGSMGKYIASTKKGLSDVALKLSENLSLGDDLQFGFVGYRDDVNRVPKMKFTAKNFTPEFVSAEVLSGILGSEVKASRYGSKDYQEEVFAGIKEAAENSAWRENAIHVIILAGDASSHEPGEHSTTNLTATTLRDGLLSDNKIQVMALHIKDPEGSDDHALAAEQFIALSRMSGPEGESAYFPVDPTQADAFGIKMKEISGTLVDILGDSGLQVAQNILSGVGAVGTTNQTQATVNKALASLLVEFVGTGMPPSDLVGWVFDRDPTKPYFEALDTRVLLNKAQLSDLYQALDDIIKAFNAAEVTQGDFFTSLQEVSSGYSKGGKNVTKLADAGLLPAFINNLPYKSLVLELTEESFSAMSTDERAAFEGDITAKREVYKTINEDVDKWMTLSDDPDAEKWYALPLSLLP